MVVRANLRERGVQAALVAAVLFGAGTPFAKILLNSTSPWMLAGLLYLGSGIGLLAYRLVRRATKVRLSKRELVPLAGAIASGGILGPVLLMAGLSRMPASGASLLLNAEGVFTALVAWIVFKENVDRRVALGMFAIAGGAVVLSWPGNAQFSDAVPTLLILGACLAWAVDNNVTRKIALNDATWLAATKGLVAGPINLVIAFALGATLPPVANTVAAMGVGVLAYGVSLALFIVALRHVGTARAGAYFSVAPFFGAIVAVSLGDKVSLQLVLAGALMAWGIYLHLTERHEHEHAHSAVEHEHVHTHDVHHQHEHNPPVPDGTRHSHQHVHTGTTHLHAHFPDSHHRHDHD